MFWQDYALAAGSLIFTLALIPSIKSSHKPAFATSVVTCGVLAMIVVTYASLSLWFAMISAALNFSGWFILAVQKYRQPHKRRR